MIQDKLTTDKQEPDEAWWEAHFDQSDWHVKWGFDSGDRFTVFPLLPKLPGENDAERWQRSFVPLRDADEMLCIASDTVEALLHRILVARFDATLEPNTKIGDSWRSDGFDWYYDNVYTVAVCRDICALMCKAAKELDALPDATLISLTETGEVAMHSNATGGATCTTPMTASEARTDCRLIAELLEKVAASAEKQGALVSFCGP